MKKIDRLLISSFIPPFLVATFIAVFVLLMQTLWLYIDDIAGKGLGIFVVIELLAYKCAGLIPLALPIGILISSVMVMGNLAEHYELSSLKSAGIPLIRIMAPILFTGLLITGFSFYSSIKLIPLANLKFGSRLWDIQQQKPTLRLEKGVFNYDFEGFAIHIGDKQGDRFIKDVLIYDHSFASAGNFTQITAREGEMFSTPDGKYFVMKLKDGYQYVENKVRIKSSDSNYPFMRTHFDQYTKVFDLSEFQMTRTDEDLFKSNRAMLSPGELQAAIDTLRSEMLRSKMELGNHLSLFFSFLEIDSAWVKNLDVQPERIEEATVYTDSLFLEMKMQSENKRNEWKLVYRNLTRDSLLPFTGQDTLTPLYASFDEYTARNVMRRTVANTRSIISESEKTLRLIANHTLNNVKNQYEKHSRYSIAVVCFIFIFIGAPMGALVKKGGLGYPILIAIIFFMLFVVLTIFCRKIAESYIFPSILSAWLPCLILLPIGLVLTWAAMNKS
jgi:lipopolysaccharide export system permease protein